MDGSRLLPSIDSNAWGRGQSQKDVKALVSGIQPSVKPASAGVALHRKISEDDDDASDSEKMVICEDESAGTDLTCSFFTGRTSETDVSACHRCLVVTSIV